MRPTYSLLDLASSLLPARWRRARARFEDALARHLGFRHVVLFPYARTALHATLRALEVEGEDVPVTSFTCVVVPQEIAAAGNRPRFVEPEDGWLAAPTAGAGARVRVVTHVFGREVDLAATPRDGGIVIEDACLAWRPKHGRPKGDVVLFSLNLSKQVTTGNGGILATDRDDLAALLREEQRRLRLPGFRGEARKLAALAWALLLYTRPSYTLAQAAKRLTGVSNAPNFSLDGTSRPPDFWDALTRVQCIVGERQLARVDRMRGRRRDLARLYARELADVDGVDLPGDAFLENPTHFLVESDRREVLRARLYRLGVNTGLPIDYTCAELPAFADAPRESASFEASRRVAARALALPFYHQMSDRDVRRIAARVREAARGLREPAPAEARAPPEVVA